MERIEYIDLGDGRGPLGTVLAGKRPRVLLMLCCGGDPLPFMKDAFGKSGPDDETALVFSMSADWDRDYTPWPSQALRGRLFSGGARNYYRTTILPLCQAAQQRFETIEAVGIAGHSLGGLFALYAASQPDSPFDRAGSVSGALWYEGFIDYLGQASFPALRQAYLSLGRREAGRGRGPMGQVNEATAQIDSLLSQRLGREKVCFEWNNGGHFYEIPQRMERAVQMLRKL